MRIATDWLAEFVTQLLSADELAEALTMRGLEVESIGRAGAELPGVVVGRVVNCAPVRETSLKDCKVDAGQAGMLQVVCGAPNVATGMKIAFAKPGAVLGGVEIEARTIRGIASQGMICSERELGLGENHEGILRLDAKSKVGESLERTLRLDASVLEVAITPNRGDCLSMLGAAREVSAFCGGRLRKIPNKFRPQSEDKHDVQILAGAADSCPLYGSVIVRGISGAGAESPLWLRERLRRCGVRPIGAAVDVTNYAMLALGQPLHAFDLGRLEGGIRVRLSREGEHLKLLDGQDARLDASTVVIADEKKAVALGGVMGGMDTGVSAETTDVLLEGAFFRPEAVRGKTRAYNLNSEAAFRFERGVDFTLPPQALQFAAKLLTSLCGGQAGPVQLTRAGELPQRQPITIQVAAFGKLLGLERSAAQAARTFRNLGFETKATRKSVTTTPPPHRFDISIPEDLVEEVARIHGYDNIPTTVPQTLGKMLFAGSASSGVSGLKRTLAGQGYSEVVTYSFVPEDWETGLHGNSKPVRLSNPITDEATVMRSSLIGGLIGRAEHNCKHRQERLQIFETGRCFPSKNAVTGEQPVKVAGLCYGPTVPGHWDGAGRTFDFFDVRNDVETLLTTEAEFVPCATHPAFHPGKCAEIRIDGRVAGHVGALHPKWAQERDLPSSSHLFELTVDSMIESEQTSVVVGKISKLPLVYRDLSVVVKASIHAGEILKEGRKLEEREEVRKVELFDCYEAEGEAEKGLKRLGFRMTLQGAEANLEDFEISALVGELEGILSAAFGARKSSMKA